MTINPSPNHIQLELDKVVIAGLDTSSKDSAIEVGKVIAVGCDVADNSKLPQVGERIIFKGWGLDIAVVNGENYYFIDTTNNSILAKVIED